MTDLIKKPSIEELQQMYSQNGSLRAEYFEAVNGRDYKPSDIRTHKDHILSYDPIQDVRIRKTVCKMNTSSNCGATKTLIGYVEAKTNTVEANVASFTNVLYFPLAKDINMVMIKSLDVQTVYPKVMIERFKMVEQSKTGRENLSSIIRLTHSANFYFSPSEENFYFFFDVRFFDNFSSESIKHILPVSKNIFVYKNLLAIRNKDLTELKNYLKSEEYLSFLNDYSNLFLDFSTGEEVIFIKYKSSKQNFLLSSRLNEVDYFSKSSSNLQFVKAIKFGKYIYFYKDGQIDAKSCQSLNNNELSLDTYQSFKNEILTGDTPLTLLIPYSDEDWNLLTSIQLKLEEISKTLEDFFVSSKSEPQKGIQFDNKLQPNLLKLLK